MEQRQRRVQHVAFAGAELPAGVDAPPEILRVRTAHAFRQAGGAGSVENGERIAGTDVRGRHFHRRRRQRLDRDLYRSRRSETLARADHPDALDCQCGKIDRLQRIEERGLDGEDARTGIAQHMLQLKAARRHVERHRNGAKPAAAQEQAQQFGAVAANNGDAVAAADAGALEQSGVARGVGTGLGVTPLHVRASEQRPVAVALGLRRQHGRHSAPRGRKRGDGGEIGLRNTEHGYLDLLWL